MTTATQYQAIDFLDQIFNNVLRPRGVEQACKPQAPAQEVRLIRVDVSESASQYVVVAELPGVRKEDIQIDIEGKILKLSAQTARPAEPTENAEGQAKRALLIERFQGKLSRSLQLPVEIDQANAQATFIDGVLELTLPKQQPRTGHRIAIQ